MTQSLTSKSANQCGQPLPELNSPEITRTVTTRSTVTRVCEVFTDLKFSVPATSSIPEVSEAIEGVLDLGKFTGDATVKVRKWSFMTAGHKGWLEARGTLKNGSPYTITLMADEPITADEVENGVSRVIPRTELAKLADNSQLVFVFKTSVEACCEEGPMVVFPELELMVKLRLIEIEEKFEAQTLSTFPAKGGVDTPTMTITFEHGEATAGIVQFHNHAFASDNHYGVVLDIHKLPSPQIHRFVFKNALVYLKYSWTSKQQDAAVTYFDEDNNLLQRLVYPGDDSAGMWLEYVPPLGKTVCSMVVEVSDHSFFDNFTMRYYG
ncbi:hypothetical protein VRB67_16410 [Pseudomonas trivialis]|uniref:hypothetical protein n=1 Tax=Pseudomonas trivialis TaxID=200450 RepID=UPI0030D26A2D